jgi:hypothetical protein
VRKTVMVSMAAAMVMASTASCDSGRGSAKPEEPGTPAVVRMSDAVDAEAGRDYDVVATLRGADADDAVALAPDGVVLLARSDLEGPYTLYDPGTGARTQVTTAPGEPVVDAVTVDDVVTSSVVRGRLTVVWFDRASGSAFRRTLPPVAALPRARPIRDVGVSDDRTVWFFTYASNGESGPATKTQLWRAPAGGRPRLVARVTDAVVTSKVVAWTRRPDRASARFHVRDLASGVTSVVSLPPDCPTGSKTASLESVRGAGDLLALQAICRHDPETRTFLIRADGRVIADVSLGDEPLPTSMGDDTLAVSPTFVYDVRDDRLLRLNHPHYEHPPWPLAAGDLVAWRTGTGVDGGALRIARLASRR